MFVVFADNNIDESYSGEFSNAWFAFLFGVACVRRGRSMGVDFYYQEDK